MKSLDSCENWKWVIQIEKCQSDDCSEYICALYSMVGELWSIFVQHFLYNTDSGEKKTKSKIDLVILYH